MTTTIRSLTARRRSARPKFHSETANGDARPLRCRHVRANLLHLPRLERRPRDQIHRCFSSWFDTASARLLARGDAEQNVTSARRASTISLGAPQGAITTAGSPHYGQVSNYVARVATTGGRSVYTESPEDRQVL